MAPPLRGQATCTKLPVCPQLVALRGKTMLGLAVSSSAENQASRPASADASAGRAATIATGPRRTRNDNQVTGVPAPVAYASSAWAMARGWPGVVATCS
jgi:hypothetical protein